MNELMNIITQIKDIQRLITLCVGVTCFDTVTGVVKHILKGDFKSRLMKQGFLGKIAWYLAILFAFFLYIVIKNSMLLYAVCFTCIATELSSLFENFTEMGVTIKYNRGDDKK